MNKYYIIIAVTVIAAIFVAHNFQMKYTHVAIFYLVVGSTMAALAIHKIKNPDRVIVILIGLSIFASRPIKEIFQIDGFFQFFMITLVYAGYFWLIGMGWRRKWTREDGI